MSLPSTFRFSEELKAESREDLANDTLASEKRELIVRARFSSE